MSLAWTTSDVVSFVPTPTQSDVQIALRNFLLAILPAGVEVILGQANRVPEPSGADFVVFTPIRRTRIETNLDFYVDCQFTASIAGTTMDVTVVQWGTIPVGNPVFGVNVASGTVVTALGSGTGGVGTYTVSPSQTVSAETMATGAANIVQPTEVVFQVDCHSANSDGADFAETISTLFRDDYAVRLFETYGFDVTPLHADDPKQIPFLNAEQQFETRWVVECCLQVNQIVSPAQQFANALKVTPIVVADQLPVS